ncbi:NUDIX domain-containing protein [Agrobacterium sp. Ap1]|uniref:NUDIX domain-containing protein n=1 Tax=Agrobacterium sp. Ap1 TaxID=2815337 RepID=UPI001A901B4F|nr:NUDIX domain-containing protein [Agrobacterium sp. Ap1]MBO0141856.1 NUDIX domain-containing protein [Agrobacterium sp. Ap1]
MSALAKPGQDFPGLGVGLVIRRADGKVLVCRRLKAPEAGHWNIVGGKVDMMEQAEDAARREAEEETGLKIGKISFLCVIEGILEEEGQHWLSLIYVTDDFSGEPVLTEPEKHADLMWIDMNEPPAPLSIFSSQAFALLKSH